MTNTKTAQQDRVTFEPRKNPARVMRAPNGRLYVVDGSIGRAKGAENTPVVVWRAWPIVALRTRDAYGARGTLPTEGAALEAPVWVPGRGVTVWSVVGDPYALVDTCGDAYLIAETPLERPKVRSAHVTWDYCALAWRATTQRRDTLRPATTIFLPAIPLFETRPDDAAIA